MILINLLPHREERRAQRKRAFFVGIAAAALGGVLVVGLWYSVLQQMTSAQQSRNDFLKAEIARLDAQIRDIANLRAEIDALKARQAAVENLQTDRNLPVYLMDELVRQTPEGVYLTSIRQNGQIIAITGIAQTNERVSEFLRNAAYNSTWFERPDLVEIKSISVVGPNKEQRRAFDFAMRVTLKRPQGTPSSAASAPASPSSAAAAKSS